MNKKRGAPYGNTNALGNKGGAPKGNKNALGNSGGGAPYGNLNAEKHGFYSYTFMRNQFLAVRVYKQLLEKGQEDKFNQVFYNILQSQNKHNTI